MKKLFLLILMTAVLTGSLVVKAPQAISAEKIADTQVTDTYILIGKRLRTRVA